MHRKAEGITQERKKITAGKRYPVGFLLELVVRVQTNESVPVPVSFSALLYNLVFDQIKREFCQICPALGRYRYHAPDLQLYIVTDPDSLIIQQKKCEISVLFSNF